MFPPARERARQGSSLGLQLDAGVAEPLAVDPRLLVDVGLGLVRLAPFAERMEIALPVRSAVDDLVTGPGVVGADWVRRPLSPQIAAPLSHIFQHSKMHPELRPSPAFDFAYRCSHFLRQPWAEADDDELPQSLARVVELCLEAGLIGERPGHRFGGCDGPGAVREELELLGLLHLRSPIGVSGDA
jgi:hypothetical protein